jgi:vacuolar-type H+-ATPase subunit H
LRDLKQCIYNHPYYIRKAIELKDQELRDARAVPKHIVEQAMKAAVSKNAKNRNFNYKKKVAYNKANGLNWKGEPINKK